MKLAELLALFPPQGRPGWKPEFAELQVAGLTHRPELLRSGMLFARFKPEAVSLPAGTVVLADTQLAGESGPLLIYADMSQVTRRMSALLCRDTLGSLRYAAVTGTNGKSTVVEFTRQILAAARPDWNAAALGTLGLQGEGFTLLSPNTTPFPLDLHAIITEARDRGVRVLVMEASSHALEQDRLEGLRFAAGAFLPITRDHLDYHGTLEDYAKAKFRLVDLVDGPIGVHRGCKVLASLDAKGHPVLSYGLTRARAGLWAEGLVPGEKGFRARLGMGDNQVVDAQLSLYGRYNVENALCAMTLAIGLGLAWAEIVPALSRLRPPRGRLQRVDLSLPGQVYIDYAHTPDGLEKVLRALREHLPGRRLRVLFGCGGERDRGKRPLMGRVAAELAAEVLLSDDNPRGEDAAAIRAEVRAGFPAGANVREVPGRLEAIHAALQDQAAGDVLLLAGKGHENYQIVGRERLRFREEEILKDYARTH